MNAARRHLLAALLLLVPALGGWLGGAVLGPDVAQSDVFVIAGQSNAVGASTQPPVPTTFLGSAFDSWVYDLCFAWEPANDPLHCYVTSGKTSAWPTFANLWTEHVRRPAIFLATAVGGTCLVGGLPSQAYWNPDLPEGELYQIMLDMVEQAVQPRDRLRAVLWYQGECEVTHRVSFETYKAALLRLGDRIQQDLGVPLVVAPISLRPPPWPAQPTRVPIHDATIAAAAEHPNILLGPSTDDLVHEADGVHIHDVATLGRRWFQAVRVGVAPRVCDDGRDDDGDGYADYPEDPGCASAGDLSERDASAACDDGVDNDGDARVDFPADPSCRSTAGSEGRTCGLGFELALVLPLLLALRRPHPKRGP